MIEKQIMYSEDLRSNGYNEYLLLLLPFVLFVCLGAPVNGQPEIAAPFLSISPSPLLNGMGQAVRRIINLSTPKSPPSIPFHGLQGGDFL